MSLLRWVSNRWHGFLIGGLGGGCSGRCWLWFDGLCVCGSVDGLMVYVCVCGFVDGLCLCVCVVMGLDRLIGVSWVCVCGSVC